MTVYALLYMFGGCYDDLKIFSNKDKALQEYERSIKEAGFNSVEEYEKELKEGDIDRKLELHFLIIEVVE